MKKISVILIGIVVVTIGLLCIPKEEKKVLVEELTNKNTTLAFYIEEENGNYTESNTIPSTGYTLNTEKSICTNNTTPVWSDNKLYLDNLQNRGTSCYLYFKIYEPTAKEIILSNYDTVLTRNDFSQTVTATTTGTIYKSLDETQYDNDGEVYYFAGNPTDNWVQFGGYWWRIIRINGNGSIRMIYQGTSANTTGEGMQIGTSAFNTNYNDNAYVGYMYGTPGSSTYETTHANINDSKIKQTLDNWYSNTSGLTSYSPYIDGNVGFCGDRQPSTSESTNDGQGGTGSTETYYGGYIRLVNSNKQPIFECENDSDLYTTSGSEQGNKALTYPIGLINADEVAYAGGVWFTNNSSYYLYTNQNYWTMSPYCFGGSNALVFRVNSTGKIGYNSVDYTDSIRPVINLKSDVTITGSGTTSDPYKVEGA